MITHYQIDSDLIKFIYKNRVGEYRIVQVVNHGGMIDYLKQLEGAKAIDRNEDIYKLYKSISI